MSGEQQMDVEALCTSTTLVTLSWHVESSGWSFVLLACPAPCVNLALLGRRQEAVIIIFLQLTGS